MPTRTCLTADEIARRQPVREALSEFWLDTELDHADVLRIAAVLRASGFAADELDRICRTEVASAVAHNLRSVAGEWAGFDSGWLRDAIVARLREPPPLERMLATLRLGRPGALGGAHDHWLAARALLESRVDDAR